VGEPWGAMNPQTAAIVVAVIALLSSLLGAWLTARYASKASRRSEANAAALEAQKVDAAAYDRARSQYEAALAEQERRIERLRADAADHRQEVASLRHRMDVWTQWATALMTANLRTTGVAFPDPPPEIGDTGADHAEGGTE